MCAEALALFAHMRVPGRYAHSDHFRVIPALVWCWLHVDGHVHGLCAGAHLSVCLVCVCVCVCVWLQGWQLQLSRPLCSSHARGRCVCPYVHMHMQAHRIHPYTLHNRKLRSKQRLPCTVMCVCVCVCVCVRSEPSIHYAGTQTSSQGEEGPGSGMGGKRHATRHVT